MQEDEGRFECFQAKICVFTSLRCVGVKTYESPFFLNGVQGVASSNLAIPTSFQDAGHTGVTP